MKLRQKPNVASSQGSSLHLVLQKPKVIIHDWDDTITGSYLAYKSYFYDFAKANKLSDPIESTIKKHWGKPVFGLIKGIWPEIDDVEGMFDNFIKVIGDPVVKYQPLAFNNAVETLINLKTKGFNLGVLSSGTKDAITSHTTRVLNGNNLHDFIFSKDDTTHHKPDPRVFNAVYDFYNAKGINYSASDFLYIGDSLIDYDAAKAAKIPFLAVTTGVHDKSQFIEAGLDKNLILSKFAHLLGLIN